MKTLKFYGCSDDTFGEYNETNTDYDNCGSNKPITFEIKAEGKSVFVTGQYSRFGNGCWGIDVAAADEDNLPDWNMRIGFEDYSTVLEIEVPDDVQIEHIER